jgi:DNA-binding transcriptional ArsR family regulator
MAGVECHGEEMPVAGISDVLQALADPIRLSIARSLADADGELSCGAFELPVTKSTATHHFRVLREAGVIGSRWEGTRKLIRLRRDDLDATYPGLLDSILRARVNENAAR